MFAGGDLDGDLYFVCWGKDMLPRKEDFAPMNYKAPKKKEESDTINLDHMTEFISEYIKRDQLGKLCISIQKPIFISSPNEKHAIHSNAIYLGLAYTVKVCAITVGILHQSILSFKGFVRKVRRN